MTVGEPGAPPNDGPSPHRRRPLRGGEERADRGGRGNEDRPRQDRLFAAAESRGRLFLRHLRRRRPDGGAGAGPADPSRLDARRRGRRGRRLPQPRTGRCFHPQRPVSRRLASARRERGRSRLRGRDAARLWLRPRALAGYRQRHARQLRRGDGNLRRGPAPAAGAALSQRRNGSRDRGDHLRQCPHAVRAHGRSARAGRGQSPRRRTHGRTRRQIRHRGTAAHHAGGAGLLRNDDARRPARCRTANPPSPTSSTATACWHPVPRPTKHSA